MNPEAAFVEFVIGVRPGGSDGAATAAGAAGADGAT
jgi:hypothetical protein